MCHLGSHRVIFTTLPHTNAQPPIGLHLIWKNVSTGDITCSSIGYSCNSGGCSGKPIPFFHQKSWNFAKWHVLHNHSLLLTEVRSFEHSANMFCSICILRNNLLTSYTDDLNHVCKQNVHIYKGPYSVFSLNMFRQSAIVLPLCWIDTQLCSDCEYFSPILLLLHFFLSFQVISFLFLKAIL